MGKVKAFKAYGLDDTRIAYQFPMGKVKPRRKSRSTLRNSVSIPYGKGKGNIASMLRR